MDIAALIEQLVAYITSLSGLTAYAAILGVLFACGMGVPIPEDITLVSAGILAGVGNISLPGAILVGFFGVMFGDAFLYTLGRIYGRKVLEAPLVRNILTPQRVLLAEQKVLENSKFICFTARFLPGLRSPVFLMSGVLGVRPAVFYGLDGLAALISVPFWVIVGWGFGQNIDEALAFAKSMQKYVIGGLVIAFIVYFGYRYMRKKRQAEETVQSEAEGDSSPK